MNDLFEYLGIGFHSALVQWIGWALLHSLWQILALSGFYLIVKRFFPASSASIRYVAACSIMLLMVLTPAGTLIYLAATESTSSAENQNLAANIEKEKGDRLAEREASGPVVPLNHVVEKNAGSEGLSAAEPSSGPPTNSRIDASLLSLLKPLLPWATTAWMIGVLLLSLRPVSGWLYVRKLRSRGFLPLPETIEETGKKLRSRLGIGRSVEFVQSSLVEVPTVVGYLKPMILVPASALSNLSVSELELIFAHELAHVRRHDYLVNLIQTGIEAILFYHPCVWWLSNQIREERENCCDDVAVGVSGNRTIYIRALARLEEGRAPVAALAANGGSLLSRVHRIASIATHQQPPQRSWFTTVLMVLFVSGIVPAAITFGSMQQAEKPSRKNETVESNVEMGVLDNQEKDEQEKSSLEPVNQGITVLLQPAKKNWQEGEFPLFTVGLKNGGGELSIPNHLNGFRLEINGKQHILQQVTTSFASQILLAKNKTVQKFVDFRFDRNGEGAPLEIRQVGWSKENKREVWINSYQLSEVAEVLGDGMIKIKDSSIRLTPGQYKVRIGIPLLNFQRNGSRLGRTEVVFSKTHTIQVQKKKPASSNDQERSKNKSSQNGDPDRSKKPHVKILSLKDGVYLAEKGSFHFEGLRNYLKTISKREGKVLDFTIEFQSKESSSQIPKKRAIETAKKIEELGAELEFREIKTYITPKIPQKIGWELKEIRREASKQQARKQFLRIEQFARLSYAEQAKRIRAFYEQLNPNTLNSFEMMLHSSFPINILKRDKDLMPGQKNEWADQLTEAAKDQSIAEVSRKLGSRFWWDMASRARVIQVFENHQDSVTSFVVEALASDDRESIDRACSVVAALKLTSVAEKLFIKFRDEEMENRSIRIALEELNDPKVTHFVLNEVRTDPRFLNKAHSLLTRSLWKKNAPKVLLDLLDSSDHDVRTSVFHSIQWCIDSKLAPGIIKMSKDKDSSVRIWSMNLASNLPKEAFKASAKELVGLLEDSNRTVRVKAIVCFAKQKDLVAGRYLLKLLRQDDLPSGNQVEVLQALVSLTGKHWPYDIHHWGLKRAQNRKVVSDFEEWLSRKMPKT